MRQSRVYAIFPIILLLTHLLISTTIPTVNANTTEHTIEFLGWHLNSDGTIDFCYRITAGSYRITKWEITSPCFTRETFVDTSPKGELNPAKNRIHFQTKIEPCETQDFCITLRIEYSSYMIAPIPYTIYYPPKEQVGTVDGPTYPDFLIPENPLGTLGAVIPLLAALGLVIASKKNMITITVQK